MIKSPLTPPPPNCNPPKSEILSKMGGNESSFGRNVLGEWADEGMTRKPVKKLSSAGQSYVTITWQAFPMPQFVLTSIVDCCNQEDVRGKYSSGCLYCRCRLQLYENLMGARSGTFCDKQQLICSISLEKLLHSKLRDNQRKI